MVEEYAVAALYLVPVAAAAVVAYLVTREPATASQVRQYELPQVSPRPIPAPRDPWEERYDRYIADVSRAKAAHPSQPSQHRRRATDPGVPGAATSTPPADQPTLMHAALSAHLSTVSRQTRGLRVPAHPIPNLASIRRPTRLGRRATHRCARRPAE